MKKEIDPNVLVQTRECNLDFQCLNEHRKPRCKVEDVIIGTIFYVKYPLGQSCNYKVSCGNDIMCLYPARAELYLKYKI